MATPQDKLAKSLAVLKKLQDEGIVAIHTKNMTRTHRERLVKNGFIKSDGSITKTVRVKSYAAINNL